MDHHTGPEISLDSIEDWIVKYRAALAEDLKRSHSRRERFRSAINDFVRQAFADLHFTPMKLSESEPGKTRNTPDIARLG